MVTPIYIMAVCVFSGAPPKKGLQSAAAFLIWGLFMVWVCLSQIPGKFGLGGDLIVPLAWILPSFILYWQRNWFLSQELSQKWLVGLQLFRVIGGVFLKKRPMVWFLRLKLLKVCAVIISPFPILNVIANTSKSLNSASSRLTTY